MNQNAVAVRIGAVHDLYDQVCLSSFFQCGMECFHQAGGQVLDEADRIGQQKCAPVFHADLPDTGIQRCKKHVFFQYLFILSGRKVSPVFDHRVQDRGFPRIGISDQGDGRKL